MPIEHNAKNVTKVPSGLEGLESVDPSLFGFSLEGLQAYAKLHEQFRRSGGDVTITLTTTPEGETVTQVSGRRPGKPQVNEYYPAIPIGNPSTGK